MKASKLLMPTLREAPAEAEISSHILMMRAALISKLAAGVYSYLPLGLKVLHNVQNIIREEMDRAGAQELLMSEEGMRKTPNRMIYIGNPIEFDEENFIEELEQLRVTENSDFAEIRAKLREVVPTYTG